MAKITPRKHKDGTVSYCIRVSNGYDINGKQTMLNMTWKPASNMTPKQIEKELNRQATLFEEKVRKGTYFDENITFEKYAQIWLENAKPNLAPLSYQSYSELLIRINAGLGHLKLSKIKAEHLKAFYKQLSEITSDKTGRKLAPQSIKHYHRCINVILESATKGELIERNVAKLVDAPKVPKKEACHLDDKQAQLFVNLLDAEKNIRTKCALSILIYSGMRKGELCGLEWKDIDFDKHIIHITKTSQFVVGQGIISKAPKNDTSVRTVKLPAYVFDIISKYKIWYSQERLLQGDNWKNSGKIFVSHDGDAIYPNTINYWLIEFLKAHPELPHITPHSLRHTFCTLLIADGVDIKTVSTKAGHSTTSTTLDIYTHAVKFANEITSSTLDDILTPKHA